MSRDQYTMTDPAALYADVTTKAQTQDGPGLDADLKEKADHGEQSYRGTGRLEGRKALITGGDSGIGAAVAIAYAREGADVAISYLPEEEEDAQRIVDLIEAAGRQALALPGDLKDPAYCRDIVEKTVTAFGGLDVLVNNGGKQQFHEDLTEISDEQFDDTLKTNVYALFWITRAALPHLKPGSTIINTSSIQAYSPSEILVDYATTKASINTFSKALSQQLAPKGIRVNVVHPARSGPRCKPPAVNRRRSSRTSASRPRWVVPDSRPSWPRPTSSSPPQNPAM